MSGIHKGYRKARFNAVARSMLSAVSVAALTTAATAALPTTVFAQGEADEATDLEELLIVARTRGFTGTKTLTPLAEIPQSISVVDQQLMFERAAQDFQDVFRYSAGASVGDSDDSRFDNVSIRSFATSIFVDGLRQTTSGTFINILKIENYTLERAELLRGPSSVLYGTGAPGGILNAISKRPQDEFGGEVAIDFGNDDRVQGKFDVTGALTETVSARLVGLVRDAESQWGTPDDRIVINPSIQWKPTDNTVVTLIGLYQDNSQGSLGYLPIPFSRDATTVDETLPFDFFQGDIDGDGDGDGFTGLEGSNWSITGIVEHEFTPNLRVRNSTRYLEGDVDYSELFTFGFILDSMGNPYAIDEVPGFTLAFEDFPDGEPFLLERSAFRAEEEYRIFNTDSSIAYDFNLGGIENSVLAGIDYFDISTEEREGFAGFLPPVDTIELFNPNASFAFTGEVPITFGNDTKTRQLGFYIQNQITAFDRLNIVLGLRHDSIKSESRFLGMGEFNEDVDVNEVSFRAGVIYEVIDGVSPYFSYAESFTPVPGSNNGNTFLPQNGRQFEAGIKWEPMPGVLISAAYFDIEEDNLLSQDPGNPNITLQGGARGTTGFEVEVLATLPGDISLTAAYTNFDAEVTETSEANSLFAGDRI
ncbi:MAG: TonB-dependent receptor, partial [Pseudomonadota bacterium]